MSGPASTRAANILYTFMDYMLLSIYVTLHIVIQCKLLFCNFKILTVKILTDWWTFSDVKSLERQPARCVDDIRKFAGIV